MFRGDKVGLVALPVGKAATAAGMGSSGTERLLQGWGSVKCGLRRLQRTLVKVRQSAIRSILWLGVETNRSGSRHWALGSRNEAAVNMSINGSRPYHQPYRGHRCRYSSLVASYSTIGITMMVSLITKRRSNKKTSRHVAPRLSTAVSTAHYFNLS